MAFVMIHTRGTPIGVHTFDFLIWIPKTNVSVAIRKSLPTNVKRAFGVDSQEKTMIKCEIIGELNASELSVSNTCQKVFFQLQCVCVHLRTSYASKLCRLGFCYPTMLEQHCFSGVCMARYTCKFLQAT